MRQEKREKTQKPKRRVFQLSLRYKLAIPILILLTFIFLVLLQTTFRTVRTLVLERNESRLKAIAEVFAETIKVPLILRNQQVLLANIEWMAKRPDVLEVRLEDAEGVTVGGEQPTYVSLPESVAQRSFFGVRRIGRENYAVAVPIMAHERRLGRVFILFSQQGLERELKQIFEARLMVAFIMAICLAILTMGMTWLVIRPLFTLKRATNEILSGDLSARAQIYSLDEIQDLGDAFNEMVSRLAESLDNLRTRTEALEESEEKYRLIVEGASDTIFTLTPEGDLVLLNRGLSGCSPGELLTNGLPLLLSLHDKESQTTFRKSLEHVKERKEPVVNAPITCIHRRTQQEVFYLLNLTPVLDHEGNLRLVQGVMRDVTELRRIEMMKDALIHDVAHELKTPTAKFQMAVEWFEKETRKSQEAKKYFQVVEILKKNAERLMRTITSIMDLSRLESGIDRITKSGLDVNKVLEQVCQDMEPLCQQKGLSLKRKFCHDLLPMRGDRDMLYRLFMNLIGNSVKFTDQGEITVTSGQEDGEILVAVQDTGVGVEEIDLEKIFDRFVQKTPSSKGIGVGLTISRDIVALHEGKIWAESKGLGKGATFKVKFPVG